MNTTPRTWAGNLGFAVTLVAAAYFVRAGVMYAIGGQLPPFITFYPAVMLVALLGGLWPGLVATGLALLATLFFIFVPEVGWQHLKSGDIIGLVMFCGINIFISWICDRNRMMRQRMAALVIKRTEELEKSREAAVAALHAEEQAHQRAEVAREESRVSAERYRALVGASSDVVYWMNADWTELRELIGRDFVADSPLPNRSWLDHYIYPADQAQVKASIQEAIRTKRMFELEHRVLRADGRVGWTYSRAVPILRGDGEIGEWFGMASDVTERKAVEEELRRREQNYREIFNATNDAIFLHDAATGRVLDMNDAMLRMHGYDSKEEYLQGNIERLLTEDPQYNWAAAQRRIRLAVEQGPQVFEWVNRRKNGELFWVEVSLRSSHIGGQGTVLAVVRDISLRKAQEIEIQRLTRLYATLSQVNQVIVRCRSRAELYDQICRVMIEFGGFRVAWIGERRGERELVAMARAGSAGAAEDAGEEWSVGAGLEAEVLHHACAMFSTQPGADPRLNQRRNFLAGLGIACCAAFPLRSQGDVCGVFSLYSCEADYFKSEERQLVEEIAEDISYALDLLHEQDRRRQAEAALRESELKHRTLLQSSRDAIMTVDPATNKFTSGNPAAVQLFGLQSEAELIHRGPPDFSPERQPDGTLSVVRGSQIDAQVMARGTVFVEWLHRRLNGEEFYADVLLTRIEWNEKPAIMATVRDITERKRAEEARLRLGTALDQAAESILITDLKGMILYVNPAFERITGYSRQEAIGENPRMLKSGKQDPAFYRQLWSTITRGQVWHGRLVNRRKDGSFYEEDATISPVRDASGKVVNYMAIKLDITRERELEHQIRQVQKMEAIGTLAGGVAHDFNNILAGMLMQLGLMKMSAPLNPEVSQGLNDLEEEARRAASLTRQLLMFSRRSVMAMKPLDVNEVVLDLLKMLSRLIGENVRLVFDGRPQSLPAVAADAGMLEQVLMNLVVNARDAMPKGGCITLATSLENFGDAECGLDPNRRPGAFVCLSVSDTGVGMSPATLERIFEPFFTTKDVGKGTGLGLATVHGIMAQHQGWVEVASEVGKGSVFRLFLPALQKQVAAAAETLAATPLHRGGEVILVVEDEPNVRRTVSKALRALGYQVHEAENGQKAMSLWQQHGSKVDLLLTDMVMPEGMTGLELAEQLQKAKPSLKVIVSSGYSSEVFQAGGIKQPGIWYLPKPYEAKTLAETLRACLG